jgi:hypothetical protein
VKLPHGFHMNSGILTEEVVLGNNKVCCLTATA